MHRQSITKLFEPNYRFFFEKISKSSKPNYSIFTPSTNRNFPLHSTVGRPKTKVNIWPSQFIILIRTGN